MCVSLEKETTEEETTEEQKNRRAKEQKQLESRRNEANVLKHIYLHPLAFFKLMQPVGNNLQNE